MSTATSGRPPRSATLRAGRAAWAWERVQQVAQGQNLTAGQQKRYGTLARRLPSLLQTSGLGQTLAFLFSKSQQPDRSKPVPGDALLLRQLGERIAGFLSLPPERAVDAVALVVGLDAGQYRALSRELRATAEWIKRFAEGLLEEEEG